MTVFEAIRQRFSVRAYKDQPVEEEKLQRVLEAARLAPSAGNRQEWRFVVVRDAALRQALVGAANSQAFVGQAPVVIAACAAGDQHVQHVMTCGQHSYPIDVAIAMENMALTAHELGLGTCWLGAFYEQQVKELLKVPEDDVRVVGLLTIGYPAVQATGKRRKPLDEIVCYETWS